MNKNLYFLFIISILKKQYGSYLKVIRTTKHTLKFTNPQKIEKIDFLFDCYFKQLEFYIQLIVNQKLPLRVNLSSKILPNYSISYSRYKQLIYKKASEIVRGELVVTKKRVYKKYQKLFYKCNKSNKNKKFTSKLYKDLNINYLKRIKIDLKNVPVMLDERFFDIEKPQSHEFNEFVSVVVPIYKTNSKILERINVPLKYHKHSLKFKDWKRKKCIQLERKNNNYNLVLFWAKEAVAPKSRATAIGIDIGYNKLISDSNGNHYGKDLKEVYNKLSKKQRGSKNYIQLLEYKRNRVNEIVNKFYKSNKFDLLFLEDLKNVKKESKFYRSLNNKMQYWSYLQVIDKLGKLSETEGFVLEKVHPAYTSQTCSKCGCVDESNRKGEIYQCSCGLVIDSDTNGAINILNRGVYSPSVTKNLPF